jgi:NAD-dependent deacetylase
MGRRVPAKAKPNPAHLALSRLEQELGERLFLCTQKVDDLHEQAGSKRVVHMARRTLQQPRRHMQPPPCRETNTYDPPAELRRCGGGGRFALPLRPSYYC